MFYWGSLPLTVLKRKSQKNIVKRRRSVHTVVVNSHESVITVCKRSLGKIMFLHMSVILFTEGCGWCDLLYDITSWSYVPARMSLSGGYGLCPGEVSVTKTPPVHPITATAADSSFPTGKSFLFTCEVDFRLVRKVCPLPLTGNENFTQASWNSDLVVQEHLETRILGSLLFPKILSKKPMPS